MIRDVYSGSWIQNPDVFHVQGSKKHRILDPDPQHYKKRENGRLTSSQGSTWTFLLNFGVLISMNAAATAYSKSVLVNMLQLIQIIQNSFFQYCRSGSGESRNL